MWLSQKSNCWRERRLWTGCLAGRPLSHSDAYLTCPRWQVPCRGSLAPGPGPQPWPPGRPWSPWRPALVITAAAHTSPACGPRLLRPSSPVNLGTPLPARVISVPRHSARCLLLFKSLSAFSHPYFHKSHFLISGFQFLNDQDLRLSLLTHWCVYVGTLTNPQRMQQPFWVPRATSKWLRQAGVLASGEMNILQQRARLFVLSILKSKKRSFT